MPLPPDPNPTLSAYAHPERLVTADWLSAHMGVPGLAIVESDENVLLYDIGHIPGASRSTGIPTSTIRACATTSTVRNLPS
ncbi:putative thiosulfate sulfurtransferase sseA domain protein [Mycobacterium ulcerans str. Harvey]|uniref:Thiosulfate sulfurtransferase sseA domain protein n=1 Tax=Mycobacterium ulcerans str. Harvey TaxID=1299332 RepID=A0ABP3AI93_MYCUL|nr:putative thiosulfate sulfurtransferase sseA domain protein [Mycobacterium ulcerans str. Harvey]